MIKLSIPNLGEDEIQAVSKVIRSGNLVFGEWGIKFEQQLAELLGCEQVVVVSSGTAALHLSLLALGIGQGDAVIVPGFTFPATGNTVLLTGATAVISDVCPLSYCMTVEYLEKVYLEWNGKEKIKAIIPVHEFGCPANMTAILDFANKNGLFVIEDAACALGSIHNNKAVGTFGDLGCFSFHPRKSITTGEGGAIATNDVVLADKLRVLRNHGLEIKENRRKFIIAGLNYRLTDIQAAIGCVQLSRIKHKIETRQQLQKTYRSLLQDVGFLSLPKEVHGHTWQTFMLLLSNQFERDKVIAELRSQGIETNFGANSLALLPYFKVKNYEFETPNADVLFNRGLVLPLCEHYTEEILIQVATAVRNIGMSQ